MSAIDRAFIRAYEIEDEAAPVSRSAAVADALPPLPHAAPMPQVEAPGAAAAQGPHFRIYREAPPATPPVGDRAASGQRRPLSTFAAQSQTVEARFRPALEVDAFRFSPVCDALVQNHKARWSAAVSALLAADDAGRSLIGVAGAAPQAGVTTVVACLARLLVEAGKTVAVVDGNFSHAQLAEALGLAVESGWEDVLAGRAPLAEGVVHSIGDQLALLPLVKGGAAAAEQLAAIHASVTAGVLRYHYDMVLFDLGALAGEAQTSVACQIARHCRLDGLALVTGPADRAAVHPEQLKQTAPELAALCFGIVQNELVAA